MTTQLTVNIPEELASRLRPWQEQLPEILELGLRHWQTHGQGDFAGLADVLESLAGLPSPQEVMALRPSPQLQERIQQLLQKTRGEGLMPEEEREWQRYQFVEHLVRLAKAKAILKLKQAGGTDESNVHSD